MEDDTNPLPAQDLPPAEPQDVEAEGEAIPKTTLNEALLERGADVLDGLPSTIAGSSRIQDYMKDLKASSCTTIVKGRSW